VCECACTCMRNVGWWKKTRRSRSCPRSRPLLQNLWQTPRKWPQQPLLCMCVCLCVHVHTHTHMDLNTFSRKCTLYDHQTTHTHTHTRTSTHTHAHTDTHGHTRVCIHTCRRTRTLRYDKTRQRVDLFRTHDEAVGIGHACAFLVEGECEGIVSHKWRSHSTHVNVSHVTHMKESCNTFGCVMSHVWTHNEVGVNASCPHIYVGASPAMRVPGECHTHG